MTPTHSLLHTYTISRRWGTKDVLSAVEATSPDAAYHDWAGQHEDPLDRDDLVIEQISDQDHDRLDQARADCIDIAYRCQCGRATGVRCEWTGPREELVHVRWVPASDRGSAAASGTYTGGAYAQSLHVTAECAEMLRYIYKDGEPTDREDPYVRIVGPAYED